MSLSPTLPTLVHLERVSSLLMNQPIPLESVSLASTSRTLILADVLSASFSSPLLVLFLASVVSSSLKKLSTRKALMVLHAWTD